MTRHKLALLLIAASLALPAAPGLAAPAAQPAAPAVPAAPAGKPLTVTGFNQTQLSLYDKDGDPLPAKVPASAFTLPISTTDGGPGATVVLTYQGKTVYAHKADLKITQPPTCAALASNDTRSDGSMRAGERMGLDENDTNCKVSGK